MGLTMNEMTSIRMALRNKQLRRVLIVGTGTLLEQGVESLLAHEADIRVSEMMYTHEDTFIQDVLKAKPNVIVFHETGLFNADRIFELLKAVPEMEALRVIILRTTNATIDFYEKRIVNATQTRDFINLVCRRA